jgi:hypothetical protein
LAGAQATQILSVVTLLNRASGPAGALLAGALADVERGEPGAGIDRISQGVDALEPSARAGLLEFAAALAETHQLETDARQLWRRVVADHPGSLEAPAALLALARSLRRQEDGRGEARELLQRLIIEYPRSALVPQARRELDQLGRRENSTP